VKEIESESVTVMTEFEKCMERKLKALGYHAKDVDVNDVSAIVSFIEDRIVRHYEIEDRGPLGERDEADGKAFSKYLKDLECPSRVIKSKDVRVRLQWLVSHATSLAFEERKKVPPVEEKHAVDENVLKSVKQLARALDIQCDDTSSTGILRTLRAVEVKLQKQLVEKTKTTSSKRASSSCDGTLRALPLGFTTGNDMLDSAATVLRMLYIEDLRTLQNDVNKLLVQVQEFTADPKTDSSLGRVGR